MGQKHKEYQACTKVQYCAHTPFVEAPLQSALVPDAQCAAHRRVQRLGQASMQGRAKGSKRGAQRTPAGSRRAAASPQPAPRSSAFLARRRQQRRKWVRACARS
eukprot:6177060-Pleurochrysis_carterae.AAC.5